MIVIGQGKKITPLCLGILWPFPVTIHLTKLALLASLLVRLKGIVCFSKWGQVHIWSRSVPYHNHRSAQPQFGEAESCSSSDAQLCTAVKFNHLKQGPLLLQTEAALIGDYKKHKLSLKHTFTQSVWLVEAVGLVCWLLAGRLTLVW